MTESQIPTAGSEAGSAAAAGRSRRRAPARSKSPARPKSARRTPSRRKPATARAAVSGSGADLQGLLRGFARKASAARGRLASASGEGAQLTRRAWQSVSGASRRSIDRLTAEWKQMDAARKAQVLAALLTALAAASTPIVRRSLKKR